ncbi:hypothetical protein HK104_003318, partial [Borealophlyctis nickersoniae]
MFRPQRALHLPIRPLLTRPQTRTFTKLYTANATASGEGRTGTVVSTEGFKAELVKPKALGGPGNSGGNVNPELLFASGYSACFLGALQAVAANRKVKLPAGTQVSALVDIGKVPDGFGLAAELKVKIPGFSQADAEKLVQGAHEMCPY